MKTTADENRDKALVHVREAIKCLAEITVNECSGSDAYRATYRASIDKSFSDLIYMRDSLSV